MTIIVEKPKIGPRGKRANFYRAYTGERSDTHAQPICDGAPGESAAVVRARAIEQLLIAANHSVVHARTARPGVDCTRDVWILRGDPVFGFEYGRVHERYERSTFHATCGLGTKSESEALATMLSHMADSYPEENWPEFLWTPHGVPVNLDAIRADIHKRNEERAKMRAG